MSIRELLLLIIGSALVSNVVLSQFLGICPFLGVSNNTDTAKGMGAAVVFVIVLATLVTHIIYMVFLAAEGPMCKALGITEGLSFLNTIVFILVIAALVQFVEMFLKKNMESLYEALGVYLPLITTNCAVLGVALNSVTKGYGLIEALAYGIGISAGFAIALVLMAGIREKIANNNIPKSFQGSPIVLVTAGLMAIAFFGFGGLIKL